MSVLPVFHCDVHGCRTLGLTLFMGHCFCDRHLKEFEARMDGRASSSVRAARCVAACEGVPDERLKPGLVAGLIAGGEAS